MRVLPAPPLSSERGAGVSAGYARPLRTKAHPMRVQFDLAALDQTFGVKTKSYLQVYTSVIRLTEILHAQASVPSQEVCLYLQAIDRCEHAQNRRRCHSHGPLEHRTPKQCGMQIRRCARCVCSSTCFLHKPLCLF